MCKYCNTKFYYDEHYYQPDGGYGDDDIEELDKMEVYNLFCCPVCGKIKPEIIEKYGSVEKALEVILYNNLKDKTRNEYNDVLNHLKLDEESEIEQYLLLNNLYIKDMILYHKCGRQIGKLNKPVTILQISQWIKSNDIHFCSKCGEKIQPLRSVVINEKEVDEPFTLVVDRQKIK